MDYEKKYQEAIERAKKLHDSYKLKAISVEEIEEIFPELQESEDERIRKAMVEFFEGKKANLVRMKDYTFPNHFPADELKLCYDALSWLEKQKEREPTLPGIEESELSPEEKMNHPLYLEGFDVGKRVGEVLKEQKSAEWSKEDEIMLNNSILSTCKFAKGDGNSYPARHLCEMQETWLKSLRPQSHWKPSEEQMETLVEAITDEKLEDTASCDKKADILQSLYDDLRKLM